MTTNRYRRPLAERVPLWPSSVAVMADLAHGPARTVEIAARTHYSIGTVSVVLAELKRLGLIERAPGWRWQRVEERNP